MRMEFRVFGMERMAETLYYKLLESINYTLILMIDLFALLCLRGDCALLMLF